jgi:hypothetical protein
MVDTLVRCSTGTWNAINSSLMTAILLKSEGIDTAVLFYQEAMVSFAEIKFELSPLLDKYAETIL